MHIQNLREGRETKNPIHDHFLPRTKTSGILKRTEMTLNILEDDVQGIFSKNPLRTQQSKGASTTVINAPFKTNKQTHTQGNYRGKSAYT